MMDPHSPTQAYRELIQFTTVGIVMTYFTCPYCRTSVKEYVVVAFYSGCLWGILWKGNEGMAQLLNCYIPWIKYPLWRASSGIVASVVFTVSMVILMLMFFEYIFDMELGSYRTSIYISIGITIMVSLVLHSRTFFQYWRQAKVAAEQFEKQSMLARYESLKSQVNPHFLFNSLNALTHLVYEDQDKAVHFIKKLADVYRYVLDTREQEVVPLSEELEFLQSYIFLQQIRFGDKLHITVTLDHQEAMVVPLSLQLLLENAIKHNVISEADPLYIRIYNETDMLVVENNKQHKSMWGSASGTGLGLDNIRKRYAFLTARPVEISDATHLFQVKIPLIQTA